MRTNYYRLGRAPKARRRLIRHLVSNLIMHERIVTTWRRAQVTHKIADKIIHLGTKKTPAALDQIKKFLYTQEQTDKLLYILVPRLEGKHSDDSSKMGVVEILRNEFPALRPLKEVRKPYKYDEAKRLIIEEIKAKVLAKTNKSI